MTQDRNKSISEHQTKETWKNNQRVQSTSQQRKYYLISISESQIWPHYKIMLPFFILGVQCPCDYFDEKWKRMHEIQYYAVQRNGCNDNIIDSFEYVTYSTYTHHHFEKSLGYWMIATKWNKTTIDNLLVVSSTQL